MPDQDRPADCIVLGFETSERSGRHYAWSKTGGTPPGRGAPFWNCGARATGFSGRVEAANLPRGHLTLKAWAIDLQDERVFPIAGAVRLQR